MTYMHSYPDCQEKGLLGCVTWANHVNIVVAAPHSVVALDRDAVKQLVDQLQAWLNQ